MPKTHLPLASSILAATISVGPNDLHPVEIKSPRDSISVAVGQHELEVTKDGLTTYTKRFKLRRGETLELNARLEPEVVAAPRGRILFSDSFDADSTSAYGLVTIFSRENLNPLRFAWVESQKAMRVVGREQAFVFPKAFSGTTDGAISATVKYERLGSLDANGHGRRVTVGLRVNPETRQGVWGGFWSFGGNQYVVIDDGTVRVPMPFRYDEGVDYRLVLRVTGTRAVVFVNDQKTLEADVSYRNSGSCAVWVYGPPSDGDPISVLVSELVVRGE